MLVVETVVRIRREHAAGKAIKAIARDLKVSRKVVRKAVRAPEGAFSYRREVQPAPKTGPFQKRLGELLEENEWRPRRDRLRLTRVYDLLLREGFEGSYDAVRRYAARWRVERRQGSGEASTAFVPSGVVVDRVDQASGAIVVSARSPAPTSSCPDCRAPALPAVLGVDGDERMVARTANPRAIAVDDLLQGAVTPAGVADGSAAPFQSP